MPLEEIIVGREPQDIIKYGKRGTAFIGRHVVGTGFESHLTNPIRMDISRPHVMLIVGKRGSGKSYSAAVIAEEIMNLPEEERLGLSCIMIDTMGIYWSMKEPNDEALLLLKEWGMKPKGFDTRNIVPAGLIDVYNKAGIPFDGTFSLRPSDLSAGDWALTFGISQMDALGILLERVMKILRGSEYGIADIVAAIEKDKRADEKEKLALQNRFIAAESWGIFSEQATSVAEFLIPGKAVVLDVSLMDWAVRNLMVGMLAREVYRARIGARREEELSRMAGESKRKVPMTWFIMDECLPFEAEVITENAHTPIGEIVKRFQGGEQFKVLGYDKSGHYDFYDVVKVWEKDEREMVELKTETGKILKCTPNHKILTRRGFMPAGVAKETGCPSINFYSPDKKLVKARIFGHLLGDGWLNSNNPLVGFSGKGDATDLERIKNDLEILGFSSDTIRKRHTKSEIMTADGKVTSIEGESQSFHASTNAYCFFSGLGAPKGRKTTAKFLLPEWLMCASSKEKAEFLAALFGSDGHLPTPMKRSPQSFGPIRISFNKSVDLEEDALLYARQIKNILEELGVVVSSIGKRQGNIKKDGTKTLKIVITLSNSVKNTARFLENVGYRYCKRKEIEGNNILAYLKAKLMLIERRNILRGEAINLHQKEGIGKCKIAKRLGMPTYQIRDWLYHGSNATTPHKFPSYKNWIAEHFKDSVIYEKIIERKFVEKEKIYDISVDKVHNFIADGCIVHNSHNFLPAEGKTAASDALLMLVTMGRQPGISTVFITQQPNKLHETSIAQADIIISHRLTSTQDVSALSGIMQTYLLEDIRKSIADMPKTKGAAVILDDNSERLFALQVRPRESWHAGGTPVALSQG